MEGLKVLDANLVVYVHPSKCKKVSQAVLRELGAMLLKTNHLGYNLTQVINSAVKFINIRIFDERFEGVLLAYDAKITDKSAKILSGVHPYFGVTLKTKLLLFSPKPNMLLEGKVVKLRQESIHVIVLGFASAVITDEDIRNEFKHRTKHGEEMFVSRAHKNHVIKVGTMVRFLVKSFDEEILHISASLVPSHTGSIHWLEKNSIEGSVANRSSKKTRDNDGESLFQDSVATDVNALILNNNHQSKTKKQKTSRIS